MQPGRYKSAGFFSIEIADPVIWQLFYVNINSIAIQVPDQLLLNYSLLLRLKTYVNFV